jgi:hypothetical protein
MFKDQTDFGDIRKIDHINQTKLLKKIIPITTAITTKIKT